MGEVCWWLQQGGLYTCEGGVDCSGEWEKDFLFGGVVPRTVSSGLARVYPQGL